MRIAAWFIGLGLILLLATSFQVTKNPSRMDLIKERVDKQIKEFIALNQQKCIDNALEEASLQVDSILLERAKASRDTFNKPAKPSKPDKPDVLLPKDSLELAPIFKEEGIEEEK